MPETLFTIDESTRTARGLVVPYGEMTDARHKYPAIFHQGTVSIPPNLAILRANREHALTDPVATFSTIDDTEAGIVATFSIEDGEDGDALIEAHKRGELTHLSGEFKRLVKRGSEVVSAVLTGAAFTSTPAFASAGLFSLDPIEEKPETPAEKPEPETPDETPVASDHEPETDPEKEETVPTATVPNTATGKPAARPGESMDASGVFALIHKAIVSHDAEAIAALRNEHGESLFALTDVKISGSNQVGTGVIQPQWLGELWDGKTYVQKFLPCLGTPQPLTSPILSGWKWTTPPTVAAWTGNKTAIPSGGIATGTQAGVMQRFAAGHDLAREFYDFPAGAEVVASYIRKLVESYAKLSDQWFRDQVIALAGAQENYDNTDVPAGVSAGWAKLVQGALSVINGDNTPSFAWVAPNVWRQILFTRTDDSLKFLTASLGLEDGQLGSFSIIPTTALPAGAVLVGAKEAVTPYQLPGSPIRVNALDIVNGGVDEAVFGYCGLMNEDAADGLALIDDAA